jgi:colanic acid biosynthesis glycosyl transferase WcaI
VNPIRSVGSAVVPKERMVAERRSAGPLRLGDANILIIGINYAPEPTGIAPYTTAMAEHLSDIASSVTVYTGVPHYPSWVVPDNYRGRLRHYESANRRMRLVRYAHYVPRHQTAITRISYEVSFLANVLAARPCRPDLVLAVSPSLGGAVAGARIAGRFGVPLITVVQDMMGLAASQSGIVGGSIVSGTTARLERYALMHSDLVAVVSETFRAALGRYGVPVERIRLLPNWAHIERGGHDRGAARRELGWQEDKFLVLHTGNMGLKQDLGNVVEAARILSAQTDVSFLLLGDGSQRRTLETQANGLPNVKFIAPLSEADYPKALAAADLLLVNERATVADMSLPSKLTSYLTAGRPVLAAVMPDGATARELARAGGAALVVPPASPTSLAEGVIMLKDDPAGCARLAACGAAYAVSHLGRAAAMRRLEDLVDEALELPRQASDAQHAPADAIPTR